MDGGITARPREHHLNLPRTPAPVSDTLGVLHNMAMRRGCVALRCAETTLFQLPLMGQASMLATHHCLPLPDRQIRSIPTSGS